MLINGEKYACEACVRGHRVSNCQHSDRPLQHINKKGRPVSQCQHCRSMRKSRSAHVKCDCGEKTHKCVHLKGGAEGHKESCCCNHGGRCTCSHKKEQPLLDTVPESESDQESAPLKVSKGGIRSRRRANTIHSDGMLTFDENGHHKPTYKHAKASQKCGPYQLNRVNSLHGTGGLGNRSVDNLLHTSSLADGSGSSDSPASSGAAQDLRQTRSETASPLMTGSSTFSQLNGQLPPLDLSGIPQYIPSAFDFFGNLSDHEQPMFSAGLSATSVDWSNYDGLDFANKAAENFAPSSYSQPQSFGGLEFNGSEQPPTLTTNTSTSGEVSESEDFLPIKSEALDFDGGFRNSTASSGYNLGQTQASLLASTDLTSIDFDDFRYMKGVGNKFLPTPTSLAGDESTLATASAAGPTSFSLEDESAFWMMPVLQDSPDPGMPFWDGQ